MPTSRPWHLDADADGGAWFLTADQTPVGYMQHADDALLILAALQLWDQQHPSPQGEEGAHV